MGQSVGELGLASLNIAVPVTGFLYALGSLFGAGGANLYSSSLGEQQERRAKSIYGASLLACTFVGIVIMAVGLLFLEPLATFLGAVGSYRQGAVDYLYYVFVLAPFTCMKCSLRIFCEMTWHHAWRLSATASV